MLKDCLIGQEAGVDEGEMSLEIGHIARLHVQDTSNRANRLLN